MVRRAKSPRARPYSAASLLPPTLSLTDSNSSNPRDQDLRKNAFVEIGHFLIAKYHESFSIQEIFIEERIWSGQKVPNHFTRPFWVTDPGGVYNSAKSEFRDNYQNLIWKRDSEIFKEIIFLDSSVHYLPIFRHFELMLKNCRW